jgi:hypothetical protein
MLPLCKAEQSLDSGSTHRGWGPLWISAQRERKEKMVMRTGLNAKLGNWIIVGALMVLISMASASYAQTQPLTDAEVYWLTYMREE